MDIGLYDKGYVSKFIPDIFTYEAYEYRYISVCKNITYGENITLIHPYISREFYFWIKDEFEEKCDIKNILKPYKLPFFEKDDNRYIHYSKKRYTIYIFYHNHLYPTIKWVNNPYKVISLNHHISRYEIIKGHYADDFPPNDKEKIIIL